jgi:hypothetical protein
MFLDAYYEIFYKEINNKSQQLDNKLSMLSVEEHILLLFSFRFFHPDVNFVIS